MCVSVDIFTLATAKKIIFYCLPIASNMCDSFRSAGAESSIQRRKTCFNNSRTQRMHAHINKRDSLLSTWKFGSARFPNSASNGVVLQFAGSPTCICFRINSIYNAAVKMFSCVWFRGLGFELVFMKYDRSRFQISNTHTNAQAITTTKKTTPEWSRKGRNEMQKDQTSICHLRGYGSWYVFYHLLLRSFVRSFSNVYRELCEAQNNVEIHFQPKSQQQQQQECGWRRTQFAILEKGIKTISNVRVEFLDLTACPWNGVPCCILDFYSQKILVCVWVSVCVRRWWKEDSSEFHSL